MTVTDISREPQKTEVIRLAAYCRVSSKSADQLHSFAAQIRYYKDYERKNPQYKLVDVYADGYDKIGLNQASLNSKAGAGLVLILCYKTAQEVKNGEKRKNYRNLQPKGRG